MKLQRRPFRLALQVLAGGPQPALEGRGLYHPVELLSLVEASMKLGECRHLKAHHFPLREERFRTAFGLWLENQIQFRIGLESPNKE